MAKYILIGVLIIIIGFLFINTPFYKDLNISSQEEKIPEVKEASERLKLLDEDLGLIKIDEGGYETTPKYYQAGIIEQGKYKGYKKIIAIRQNWGQMGYSVDEFVTNDNKSYIYDNTSEIYEYSFEDLSFNTEKVTSKDAVGQGVSLAIPLDKDISLYKETIAVDSKKLDKTDSYGNQFSDYFLITDVSDYKELKSPDYKYKIYYKNIPKDKFTKYTEDPILNAYNDTGDLLESDTRVLVIDQWGLPTFYTLAFNKTIEESKTLRKEYIEYEKRRRKAVNEGNENYTEPLIEYPVTPNIRLKSSDILDLTLKLFEKYDVAFPQPCAYDGVTITTSKLKDNQLIKVGKIYNKDIYTLKDLNNPLNNLSYVNKSTIPDEEWFKELKEELPSYKEYKAKYPILFIKDYWGRWIVLGENNVKLPVGGCGKPVVYLYPEKPTEVTVKLQRNIDFEHMIPNYHNGWKVEAYPDGKLEDLQTEYTDCSSIKTQIPGLEYGKKACLENSYPYLYWSGNSYGAKYPDITQGWIVSKEELEDFMNNKLNEIGLSQKEKSDMLEYWLREMLNKNAPFYRISFLQTIEMNKMIPMEIDPKPDSLYRVFLDYLPLNSEPEFGIDPQKLEKIQRRGFTVIEWGGLKR